METPSDLKYSRDHEWVRVEDDMVIIGITAYAQGELGDVVFVELPEIGKHLEQGDAFGTIEAVKAVSDLYSPVSGEVVEINELLESDPALVNQSPFEDGWMVKVAASDMSELDDLMDANAYKEMVGA
ncbi:MAG: glycine cleavage system protein GcvH [candidate division Zixibacteria bacterium]|nr:glycine cleavage system protein GcvH [candidate division Zixibacteria bacterium]MBU1470757.1 glycine cleavage system protein GcvH [candidate division Zixibacteria bacterium]MBU2624483.1 glycine cleavage system protein GcvH [candidate division Zixibacteria bacterium]